MFPPWVSIDVPTRTVLHSEYLASEMPKYPRIDQFPIWFSRDVAAVIDYKMLATRIGLGECFVLALYLTWGRMPRRLESSRARAPESKAQVQEDVAGLIAALRQSLRVKVGWDEAKIDRLIEYERERLGNLPLQTLMAAAIERWERDNR